jgi:hypothetical protein
LLRRFNTTADTVTLPDERWNCDGADSEVDDQNLKLISENVAERKNPIGNILF